MKFDVYIFKRKSKGDPRADKWVLRLRWKDAATDKIKVAEKQLNTRTAARDFVNEFKGIIEKRETPTDTGFVPDKADLTFAELVERCRVWRFHAWDGISGIKAISTVNAGLNNLSRFFGDRRIRTIDDIALNDYRRWRLKDGSQNPSLVRKGIKRDVQKSTVNREMTVCRTMFNYALHRGWIDRDIFKFSQAFDTSDVKPRQRVPDHIELDRLLAACDQIENPFLKTAVLLGAFCGLRKNEALSLKWSNVDLMRRRLTVLSENSKTNKAKTVGIMRPVLAALEVLNSVRPDGIEDPFVFYSPQDHSHHTTNITRQWKKAIKIAKLDGLNFHDLRRFAATHLVNDLGLTFDFAGKLLGHAPGSRITEKHYVVTRSDAMDKILDLMDQFYEDRTTLEASDAEN